jgi:hypothetical protein
MKFEDNGDINKEKYVGNPFNCRFVTVEFKEFIALKGEELFLSRLKFFFNRKEKHLLAIQFIFQTKENFGNNDPSTFVSFEEKDTNKFIGALTNYAPLNKDFIDNVEEYNLYFSFGEEICSLAGEYKDNSFHKINIRTNFGKFFIIGDQKLDDNFHFKFLYNGAFFGGLIIGVLDNKIVYLKPLHYEDKDKFEQVKNTQETKHKKELIDISEDLTFLKKVEPIYKTNINGISNQKTIIVDDMEKTGLITEIKAKIAALSEIKIFSNGKRITRIDNQYTFLENKQKNIVVSHISQEYNDTNKNFILKLDEDDYLSKAVIFISKSKKILKDIEFITKNGHILRTFKDRPKYFRELKETSGKKLRILGMCIGREKYIQFIQFYYELMNIN